MPISTKLNCGLYWVQGIGWRGSVDKNYPSYRAAKIAAKRIATKIQKLTPDWYFYWELTNINDNELFYPYWKMTGEVYEIK